MTAVRRAVVAAGVLLMLASGGAAAASPQATAAVSDTGWWSKRTGATAQPAGFFEVASGIDGIESVAALKVELSARVMQATLQITESGGVATSTGAMQVCATSATWTAANPGAFADAPAADCTTHAALTRDASGQWTGDVSALLAGSSKSVSLMIVPFITPIAGLVNAGFSAQFQPALVRATAAPSSSPSSSASDSTPVGGAGRPPSVVAPAPRIAAPPVTRVVPTSPTTTAPPSTAPGASGAASAPYGVSIAGARGDHKPWGRLLWLVPLSVGGGFMAVGLRRTYRRVAPS